MVTYQPGITLEQIEKETIYAALKFWNGNKTRAAHALGITVKTIHNKLNSYEKGKKSEDNPSNK